MAKSYNQKVKILYLEKMLRDSGEDRVVTMQEILTKLLEYGIRAERKSIYDDIEALRSFGMDVKFRRGRPGGYYLAGQMAPEITVKEPVEKAADTVAPAEPETEAVKAPGEDWSFVKEAGGGKQIKLLCDNGVRENTEAYFGKKAQYKEKGLGYFTVTAEISEGPQFYGWLTSMGSKVHILKPKKTAQSYREYLKTLAKEYKGV